MMISTGNPAAVRTIKKASSGKTVFQEQFQYLPRLAIFSLTGSVRVGNIYFLRRDFFKLPTELTGNVIEYLYFFGPVCLSLVKHITVIAVMFTTHVWVNLIIKVF